MIPADQSCLQKIFTHYEELTNLSGLKLNADKTEIISNGLTRGFNITYLGDIHEISVGEEMKVNGLVLSYNKDITYKKNFGKLFNAMERQLTSWSNRGLSLLGKILIYKTFGLSQILFIGSVISLTKKDESKSVVPINIRLKDRVSTTNLIIGRAVNEVTLQMAFESFSLCRFEMDLIKERRILVPRD